MNFLHRWICSSNIWKRGLYQGILPWTLQQEELGGSVLEIGPGCGLTTEWLRGRCDRITAVEIDSVLARAARARTQGTNATIIRGDGTALPFASGVFSSVVSVAMLHHVPSVEQQDHLLREAFRVLQPGGLFLTMDVRATRTMRAIHWGGVYVPVNPETLAPRLRAAGFINPAVEANGWIFRFRVQRP